MEIFELTKGFRPEEKYSMVDQMRRSSRSVCTNIAEPVSDPEGIMFVYVLHSHRSGRRYIGHTSDLYRRIKEHNSGRVKSTKAGMPWQLITSREYLSRSEARWVERSLKRSKRDLDEFLGL